MTLWHNLWEAVKAVLPDARHVTGACLREVADPTLERAEARARALLDHAAEHEHALLEDGEARAHRVVEDVDHRLSVQREQWLDRTEKITRRFVLRVLLVGLVLVGAAGAVTVIVVWASQHVK
ncbi:MAG: hypothetical protein M5U26_13290 [Planctomycetota bacterium]|nr:hypothetical protein [Planctomycetota bacterium]